MLETTNILPVMRAASVRFKGYETKSLVRLYGNFAATLISWVYAGRVIANEAYVDIP